MGMCPMKVRIWSEQGYDFLLYTILILLLSSAKHIRKTVLTGSKQKEKGRNSVGSMSCFSKSSIRRETPGEGICVESIESARSCWGPPDSDKNKNQGVLWGDACQLHSHFGEIYSSPKFPGDFLLREGHLGSCLERQTGGQRAKGHTRMIYSQTRTFCE